MQELSFEDVLEMIRVKDSRYQSQAYFFVREALDYTQKHTVKDRKNEVRHVTGQELLDGIREYGLAQFGPMTLFVFEEWGITRAEDFGEIVFNMVDIGLLSKTANDSRNDFKGGYNFVKTFRDPFLPPSKNRLPEPESQRS